MSSPPPDMDKAAHLLDPIEGYRSIPDEDDLRVNCRRVELGAILLAVVAVVQAAGNVWHGVASLWVLIGVALSGAWLFHRAARRAQRVPTFRAARLAEHFVIFCALCSSCAGWIAGMEGYVTSGYSLTILCGALFLMIPARRFATIGIATYVFFVMWSVTLPVPFFTKFYSITNTGFCVLVACMGRIGIERIQQISRQQRIQIARQNERLLRTNETLEARNEELNDLMAVTAHDLRSPLIGLRNVLDMAHAGGADDRESLNRVLGAARQSVTAMLAFVSRLLDVHAVEARAAPILRPTDLTAKLAAAVPRMEPLARGAGIDLVVIAPADPVVIAGHGESIAQILDNLLSNAIRYSPAGSTVEARILTDSDGSSIEIVDAGIGIAEADRATLFTKFRRGSRPPFDGVRGSGLGLYIVAILSRQIGAACDYRPDPAGGSIFRVRFGAAGRIAGADLGDRS